MEASQEKIEKELILLGATAIEDKLQDEVGNIFWLISKNQLENKRWHYRKIESCRDKSMGLDWR